MSCKHKPIPAGTRFGRLVVTSAPTITKGKGNIMYECRCDCGSPDRYYYSNKLKSGWTRSCGCLRRDNLSAKWKSGEIYRDENGKMRSRKKFPSTKERN